MTKLTFCSFFSGGGIADLGAHDAGLEIVKAVEYNPNPKYGPTDVIAQWYRKNLGDHCLCEDICTVDESEFEGIDFMHFSPPCPNFSVAKTGACETEADLDLARACARIFTHCRPKYVTIENVRAYQTSRSFEIILKALTADGYQYKFSVVDAADHGVPQNRERLILRAVLGASVPPLVQTHCDTKKLADRQAQANLFGYDELLPWNGWYAAIEDLLPGLEDSQFAPWQLARLPPELRTLLVGVQGEGNVNTNAFLCSGTDATLREPSEPAVTVTAALGNGTIADKAFLIENQQNCRESSVRNGDEPMVTVNTGNAGISSHRPMAFVCDGTTNICGETLSVRDKQEPSLTVTATVEKRMPRAFYGAFYPDGQTGSGSTKIPIISADEPATTVTSINGPKGARVFTNGRIVKLSTRCLARFQTIPDWYELPKQNSLAGRIIGNGIPSLLMRRIVESLIACK